MMAGFGGGFHAACKECRYGQLGNALVSRHNLHAACCQMADKPFTCTPGDQYLHAVKRMCVFMTIAMDSHIGIKIESIDFPRRRLSIRLEHYEATGPSGVPSDGTKILTANCDSHGFFRFKDC